MQSLEKVVGEKLDFETFRKKYDRKRSEKLNSTALVGSVLMGMTAGAGLVCYGLTEMGLNKGLFPKPSTMDYIIGYLVAAPLWAIPAALGAALTFPVFLIPSGACAVAGEVARETIFPVSRMYKRYSADFDEVSKIGDESLRANDSRYKRLKKTVDYLGHHPPILSIIKGTSKQEEMLAEVYQVQTDREEVEFALMHDIEHVLSYNHRSLGQPFEYDGIFKEKLDYESFRNRRLWDKNSFVLPFAVNLIAGAAAGGLLGYNFGDSLCKGSDISYVINSVYAGIGGLFGAGGAYVIGNAIFSGIRKLFPSHFDYSRDFAKYSSEFDALDKFRKDYLSKNEKLCGCGSKIASDLYRDYAERVRASWAIPRIRKLARCYYVTPTQYGGNCNAQGGEYSNRAKG